MERLARELHVSTSPVRHALLRLEREGLVAATPFRGFTATWLVDIDTVLHTYAFRGIIEPAAAAIAARRPPSDASRLLPLLCDAAEGVSDSSLRSRGRLLDLHRRFHEAVAAASDNPLIVQALAPALASIHVGTVGLSEDARRQSWQEHRVIAGAISDQNPDEAAAAMREHLQNGVNRVALAAR